MQFEKGNEWWRMAKNPGRKPYYDNVNDLIEDFNKYLEHADKKLWEKDDWVGKDAEKITRKFITPYSITGFCVFIGASRHWWNEFRKSCVKKGEDDFLEILARIEDTFYTQKFEGASIGFFNPSIISQDLGLVSKTEVDEKSTKKATIVMNIVRPVGNKVVGE